MIQFSHAAVAKLADALALGASDRKDVWVQLPLAALNFYYGQLAQLVERFIYTEDVGGSSPSLST